MSAYRDEGRPTSWPERVTTTDALPGFVVEKLIAVVWGGLSAQPLRAPNGDSVYDRVLQKAIGELTLAAEQRGANAVTGLRFVSLDPTGFSVAAYGNAVWVTPMR